MSRQNEIQKAQNEMYLSLRKDILRGNLTTGERLIESKISEQYGINRIYAKEVFQRLESEELAQYIPMKGYFVKGLTKADLTELSLIREALEALVVENFILTANEEEITAVIKKCNKKILFLRNNEIEFAVDETKEIFGCIYRQSQYRKIVMMLINYGDYFDIIIKKNIATPEDVNKSIKNTQLLAEAFEQKNVSLARQCMKTRHENFYHTLI